MKKLIYLRGQNLTEVAIVIGVVGLVWVGIQVYVARGVQGKLKNLTDNMIGTEQSAYTQDVSGYEINTSDSVVTMRSKMRATESTAGVKSLISVEPEITQQTIITQSND